MYQIKLYDTERLQTFDITQSTMGLTMNEHLDRDITTFSINCKNLYETHLFNHLTVLKDGNTILTGETLEQEDSDGGKLNFKVSNITGEDWGRILNERVVSEFYIKGDARQGRPDLILKHLFAKYAPEFSLNNVRQCDVVIDELEFKYCSLKEAIETIMDLLFDWHWYIDPSKDFHFFYRYESNGELFGIHNIDIKSLRNVSSGIDHCNRIWLVGRKAAAPQRIDMFYNYDGSQRYFSLPFEPVDLKIYVNDLPVDISLEANDNGNRSFLYNKAKKVFYIPTYKSVPATGRIKASFNPVKQFIDYYENPQDIKKNGLKEKAVLNSAIVDKIEARRYGMAEVKKRSSSRRKISFRANSANVKIGQRCSVNIQTEFWDITGYFLVKNVKTNIAPQGVFKQFELEEIS